ncbi:hypothetical protein [Novosphingobium sp. MMS21-SN21R]|uniref:hypothetical protein n=1 Tax=Novosphingobium sp. MMS21-SN21R TaxID=2969298 RepID=UPI002887C283|nr:hypothetical protein [Novosphingobium sp. MMS21-SN21R]MDT0507533.1 hypothetical protein [Novosphingobium sp. MMS21-SN21R]
MADFLIRREVLEKVFGTRWGAAFENQQQVLSDVQASTTTNVADTQLLKDAAFVTLSENAELPNERVLSLGDGLESVVTSGTVLIRLSVDGARVSGGFKVTFVATGESTVVVPLAGILATRDNAETLTKKTLDKPAITGLVNALDDVAAATAGVEVGSVYRNGSVLMIRVV